MLSMKTYRDQMKTSFLKPFGIVSLSFLLVFSGVAWALENCLEDGEDHEPAASSEGSISSPVKLAHHPITIIHCTISHHEIGPMARGATTLSMALSGKSTLSKVSLPGVYLVASETNSLWLTSFLDWYALHSAPGGRSRYLFLSVFRI